jgi:arabinose-5-phosphate isomerase
MDTKAIARIQKVIFSAKESVTNLEKVAQNEWDDVVRVLKNRKGKIVFTGIGKSGYVGMKLTATFTSMGHKSLFIHPVEAMHGDSGGVDDGDVIIALSYSGNTKELIYFLTHAKQMAHVDVIGVTGGKESGLAKIADTVLPIRISEEGCPHNLAPMASTTAMMVAGDALAAALTEPESFTQKDFARFHPSGTLGLSLTKVSEVYAENEHVFILHTEPMQNVLLRISEVGKGIVGVLSGEGKLIGAVTDGDIRRFFLKNTTCVGYIAEDVMSPTPKYVHTEHTLKDALGVMELHKITSVFVVKENGEPCGVIHIHDIL